MYIKEEFRGKKLALQFMKELQNVILFNIYCVKITNFKRINEVGILHMV